MPEINLLFVAEFHSIKEISTGGLYLGNGHNGFHLLPMHYKKENVIGNTIRLTVKRVSETRHGKKTSVVIEFPNGGCAIFPVSFLKKHEVLPILSDK